MSKISHPSRSVDARILPVFRAVRPAFAAFLLLVALASARSQSTASPHISGPIDDTQRVALAGNVHPLARSEFDRGPVDDDFPAERLILLLRRSDAQQAVLADRIQAMHTPGDPEFHKWLKPEEFGRLYGPPDSDLAAVTAWLEAHGFTVNRVHPGRTAIEFSGTAAQLREAFHTALHSYRIDGQAHVAIDRDPEIPAALAPVIAGLAPVNDFRAQPQHKEAGRARFNPKTHATKPEWTYPNGGTSFSLALAPGDFAVQYDLNPVYKSGVTGAGQSIAIVNRSNIDLAQVAAYQALFKLPANLPAVVVDGSDPGINADSTEAYLDVELAASVAPAAQILLYTSGGTALTDGLSLAALRAVSDDLAGVISVSYGECEGDLGQGGNAFWFETWQQAAAQGQTVFVAAGDSGSGGCDSAATQSIAYSGLAVNGIGSTPYNVSVGGTDFSYSGVNQSSAALNDQIATYWSGTSGTATGTSSPAVSLLQPVPEQAWNDMFGFNTADQTYPPNPADGPFGENILAGGGGASTAALYGSPGRPGIGYAKPPWQAGPGVPADKLRDLPDVSLFAGNAANRSFFPICAHPGDCVNLNPSANGGAPWVTAIGGTSAASPAMAAIQALIDQSTQSWQGQADFFYYPIARQWPDAFHDVTVGSNTVPCYAGSPNCFVSTSGLSKGYPVEHGYNAGPGYDQATGLGSVDVANLIFWWPHVVMTATSTTFSVTPATFVHGKTAAIAATVAPKSGSAVPSGFVSLTSNDSVSHSAGIDALALSSKGAIATTIDNLPGGTYQLIARYGGDGVFAPSVSPPVTVTVTPENDTLAVSGWVLNPADLNLYPLSPGVTVPYGAQIFLDAQPVSSNASQASLSQPATGTVTFTDKTASTSVTSAQPLDIAGAAEWETGVFAVGSHSVAEAYSGDASYNPSAVSAAANFTVIPGSTTLAGRALDASVAPGGSVTVDVQLFTGYQPFLGALPTGSVTVTLGGVSKTVPWSSFGPAGDAYLEALVSFTGIPAGILPVTAAYPGDANWLGSSANLGTVVALSAKLAPTVTLTTSVANPAPAQAFTMTATVTGPTGKPLPTGTVTLLTDDETVTRAYPLVNGKATASLTGSFAANGTNLVAAWYQGDANYSPGASSAVSLAVSDAGFSLTTPTPKLSLAPGKPGVATLVLSPTDGFNQAITLSVNAPSGIAIRLGALAATVSKPTTEAVNVSVAAGKPPGTYPVVITASTAGHKIVHTALILVEVP